MPDEAMLREQAREAVRTGKLPARRPDRTWGGPGVGAPCAICEKPVARAEMEFEIEFEHEGAVPGLDKFHVHIRCFAAWELERKHAGEGAALKLPARTPDDVLHGQVVHTQAVRLS